MKEIFTRPIKWLFSILLLPFKLLLSAVGSLISLIISVILFILLLVLIGWVIGIVPGPDIIGGSDMLGMIQLLS